MALKDKGSMVITVPQSVLNFDNSADYAMLPGGNDYLDIPAGGKVTVSVWCNPHSVADSGYIFAKRSNSADGYAIFTENVGQVRIVNAGATLFRTTEALEVNKWQHVAFTSDSTTTTIYIDGAQVKTGTNDAIGANSYSGAIGCRFDASYNSTLPWSGQICDLVVWSGVALTSSQIEQAYYGIDVESDKIVGRWPCTDREGDELTDSTGHGLTGYVYREEMWTDRDIRCWCNRWDEGNWDVTIETMMDAHDRNFLFEHVTPGAVSELYNILGTPYYKDSTLKSGNTLIIAPYSSDFGLNDLAQSRTIAVKNISDDFVNWEIFGIKIEGLRLDV